MCSFLHIFVKIYYSDPAGLRSGGCCVPCGVSSVFVGRKAVGAGVMCREHASVYELGMSQVCT